MKQVFERLAQILQEYQETGEEKIGCYITVGTAIWEWNGEQFAKLPEDLVEELKKENDE
jgi:hypothetical protein